MLKRRRVIGCEMHVRQAPETGRHPVDDRSCLDSCDDDLPGSIDPSQDVFAQCRASAPRDTDDVFNPERAAEVHRSGRSHQPSIASGDFSSDDVLRGRVAGLARCRRRTRGAMQSSAVRLAMLPSSPDPDPKKDERGKHEKPQWVQHDHGTGEDHIRSASIALSSIALSRSSSLPTWRPCGPLSGSGYELFARRWNRGSTRCSRSG